MSGKLLKMAALPFSISNLAVGNGSIDRENERFFTIKNTLVPYYIENKTFR